MYKFGDDSLVKRDVNKMGLTELVDGRRQPERDGHQRDAHHEYEGSHRSHYDAHDLPGPVVAGRAVLVPEPGLRVQPPSMPPQVSQVPQVLQGGGHGGPVTADQGVVVTDSMFLLPCAVRVVVMVPGVL